MPCLDIIFRPFAVGYHVFINQDGSFRQDGFVMSQQVFMIMASVGFAVAFEEYLANYQSVTVEHYHVDIILTVYMLIACLIMWCFICSGCTKSLVKPKEESAQFQGITDKIKYIIEEHVQAIGLCLFFFLSLFDDIPSIFGNISCSAEYRECGIMLPHATEMAFRVSRVIFMASEMVFCIKFHGQRFASRCSVRYSLFVILGATISIWFHSILTESAEHFVCKEYLYSDMYKCLVNVSDVPSIHKVQCITQTTPFHKSYENLAPYFYPIIIEFALIVCEILVHLYFTITPEDGNGEQPQVIEQNPVLRNGEETTFMEHPAVDEPPAPNNGLYQNAPANDVPVPQETPLLGQPESTVSPVTIGLLVFVSSLLIMAISIITATLTSLDNRVNGTLNKTPGCNVSSQAFGEMTGKFNLSMAPDQELTRSNSWSHNETSQEFKSNEKVSYTWRYTYESYQVFFLTLLSVDMMIGFLLSKDFVSCSQTAKEHGYSGLEQLLILSTIGFYVWSTLSLIATIAILKGTHKPGGEGFQDSLPAGMAVVTLLRQILNGLEIFLQTPFALHIGKVRSSNPGHLKAILTRNTVLFMVIANLCAWTIESFVQMSNDYLEPLNNYYYSEKEWILITHITGPFIYFYRFTSTILLFKSWISSVS